MNHAELRVGSTRCAHALLLGLMVALAGAGCARDRAEPASQAQPNVAGSASAALEADAAAIPDFRRYMLGDLPTTPDATRDPFGLRKSAAAPSEVMAPTTPAPRPAPALRGIVRSQGRLVAMFDGGSASAGDAVAGWRVIEVDERSVVIERGSRRLRVSL